MRSLLARWLGRRPRPDVAHRTFTVYTRAECECCRKALALLEDYRALYGFTMRTIDVDTDPALAEAHGTSVPVVALDGKVRFRGVVNPVLLQRLLDAERRGD